MSDFASKLAAMPADKRLYALRSLPTHLNEADDTEKLRTVLTTFDFLESKVEAVDPQALIRDLGYVEDKTINVLRETVQLAAYVLSRSSGEFRAQMLGRLMFNKDKMLRGILDQAAGNSRGRLWLRALSPTLSQTGGPLRFALRMAGHVQRPYLALSVDSRWLVSLDAETRPDGGEEGRLVLWDLSVPQIERVISPGDGQYMEYAIHDLRLTPDTRLALLAGSFIQVWDLQEGQLLRKLWTQGGEKFSRMTLLPDGRTVLASAGRITYQFDAYTGTTLEPLKKWDGNLAVVEALPGGRYVLCHTPDYQFKVWDLKRNKVAYKMHGSMDVNRYGSMTGSVVHMAVSRNGKRLLAGSMDGILKTWEIRRNARAIELKRPIDKGVKIAEAVNTAVSISPDGRLGYVLSIEENHVIVWDLNRRRVSRQLEGHFGGSINKTAVVSEDGNTLVTHDGTVMLWDLKRKDAAAARRADFDGGSPVRITRAGDHAVTTSGDSLYIWDLKRLRMARKISAELRDTTIKAVTATPDGKLAATGHQNVAEYLDYDTPGGASPDKRSSVIRVWNLRNGRLLRMLRGHTLGLRALSITPDGKLLASASVDKTARIWNLRNGRQKKLLKVGAPVWTIAITTDGSRVITGSWPATLTIWDTRSGKALKRLDANRLGLGDDFSIEDMEMMVITPDGRRALWGNTLWDLERRQFLHQLPRDDYIRFAKPFGWLSPDGKHAVYDEGVWDVDTGTQVQGMPGSVAMAVDPSGQRVLSEIDGTLVLWGISSRQEFGRFTPDSPPREAMITDYGMLVILGDRLGYTHFLKLEGAG